MEEFSASKILILINLYYVVLCIKLKHTTKKYLIVLHVSNLIRDLSQGSCTRHIKDNNFDSLYF